MVMMALQACADELPRHRKLLIPYDGPASTPTPAQGAATGEGVLEFPPNRRIRLDPPWQPEPSAHALGQEYSHRQARTECSPRRPGVRPTNELLGTTRTRRHRQPGVGFRHSYTGQQLKAAGSSRLLERNAKMGENESARRTISRVTLPTPHIARPGRLETQHRR